MPVQKSISALELSEPKRFGRSPVSLPLVKYTSDLGPLPTSISAVNLRAYKYQPKQIQDSYHNPSWFWRYYQDDGWRDCKATYKYQLGSRFWPSVSKFRRHYDAKARYVGPSWTPRYGNWDHLDALEPNYWRRANRDNSYYQSYKSWFNKSHTEDDYLAATPWTYSFKLPFYNYRYHTPRTPYLYNY